MRCHLGSLPLPFSSPCSLSWLSLRGFSDPRRLLYRRPPAGTAGMSSPRWGSMGSLVTHHLKWVTHVFAFITCFFLTCGSHPKLLINDKMHNFLFGSRLSGAERKENACKRLCFSSVFNFSLFKSSLFPFSQAFCWPNDFHFDRKLIAFFSLLCMFWRFWVVILFSVDSGDYLSDIKFFIYK